MIYIQGYASIFSNQDSQNDIIMPDAFQDVIKLIGKIPLLWQHKPNKQIGMVEKIHQDSKGLYITARLLTDTKYGFMAYTRIKNGNMSMSIGYSPIQTFQDKQTRIRYIQKLSLHEVSVVTNPANRLATIDRIYAQN